MPGAAKGWRRATTSATSTASTARGRKSPLETLAARLTAQKLVDESVFERIQTDVKAEIDSGVQFALAAPHPEASEVDQDVYA